MRETSTRPEPATSAEHRQTKVCAKCLEMKPLSAFSPDKKMRDGHNSYCKPCHCAVDNGRPVSVQGERVCAREGCDTKLSKYNRGPLCMPCEDQAIAKRVAAIPISRPLPRTNETRQEAHMEERPTRTIQPYPGVTLTPARVPNRTGRDWDVVVEAFLKSGEACAVVEATGVKNASSIYASLNSATKGQPCRAMVRNDKCYLVRKGGKE